MAQTAEVLLEGKREAELPAHVAGSFLTVLINCTRIADLLRLFYTPRPKTTPKSQIKQAFSKLTLHEYSKNRFILTVPTLGEAFPQAYQPALFEEKAPSLPEKNLSLLDVLGSALADINSKSESPIAMDYTFIKEVSKLGNFIKYYDSIVIDTGQPSRFAYTQETNRIVRDLLSQPPYRRTQWVSGILDSLRMSTGTFTLNTNLTSIRGALIGIDSEEIKHYLGQKVKLRGKVYYDYQYRPIRVEALEILPIDESEAELYAFRAPVQRPKERVNLVGTWPGNETDEEIEDFLKSID